jgi:tricorn protease
MIWDRYSENISPLTNSFADSFSPTWDRDKKHFYFLASTDLALGSGWANTSAMGANPSYAAYVVVLQEDQESPFIPRSDEEEVKEKEEKDKDDAKKDTKDKEEKDEKEEKGTDEEKKEEKKDEEPGSVKIDFENIERRTIALPMEVANYAGIVQGPEGSFFLGERKPDTRGLVLHKFSLKDREAKEFDSGVFQFSVSHDGKKILINSSGSWKIAGTSGDSGKGGKTVRFTLKTKLDRHAEWKQMFEEAWRYERDYFYDPNMHGRNWETVYKRYAPLVPFVNHRADLTYILDQVNGELSVGHSFVFGGDYPDVASSELGLLGADLSLENNLWKISRIYTTESWNPDLSSPLDRPGLKVKEGDYLLGINGQELTGAMDPYQLLDGTVGKNTSIHIGSQPIFDSATIEIVMPIGNETGLRRRVWVEDNRRMVDELSGGKLGYVWVPNTGGPGYVSFNRYFFAQQDKEGMVIDERFNGGGLLDDYMVDLMTRNLRAAITNEVPGGKPFRLPAGNLGPKVLLINEMAGSGGDFFPWVFRQQKAGKLIGATTWGGLVKSSVHYGLVDGGALTAPDNAVFDPVKNEYIGENKGIAPDIAVRQDAKALEEGRDPQLEKAVEVLLEELKGLKKLNITKPPYNSPAKGK